VIDIMFGDKALDAHTMIVHGLRNIEEDFALEKNGFHVRRLRIERHFVFDQG
jgi:hypothetical protein